MLRPIFERFYAGKQIYSATSGYARGDCRRFVRRSIAMKRSIWPASARRVCTIPGSRSSKCRANRARPSSATTRKNASRGRNTAPSFPGTRCNRSRPRCSASASAPSASQHGWATWDYASFAATMSRTILEEFPANLGLLRMRETPILNASQLDPATRGPRHLGRALGMSAPCRSSACRTTTTMPGSRLPCRHLRAARRR